jgi:predicted nuclease of restriction endonuclease-like (RecB) superfamily
VNYDNAVEIIKTAILQSQYDAVRSVNEKQLMLYYAIGKYISLNSRKGFWGKGAIDAISKRLDKELPGLKGFSARSLRYMRTFYEEWSYLDKSEPVLESDNGNLAPAGAKLEISNWNQLVPTQIEFPDTSFFAIGFSHHRTILSKIKDTNERIFYIRRCADEKYSREELIASIARDDYHHQGSLPNNFLQTLPEEEQAFRAISNSRMSIFWIISMWRNWESGISRMWTSGWWRTPLSIMLRTSSLLSGRTLPSSATSIIWAVSFGCLRGRPVY